MYLQLTNELDQMGKSVVTTQPKVDTKKKITWSPIIACNLVWYSFILSIASPFTLYHTFHYNRCTVL
jgi:hypothetical protein